MKNKRTKHPTAKAGDNKQIVIIGILLVLAAALTFLILTDEKSAVLPEGPGANESLLEENERVIYGENERAVEVVEDLTGAVQVVSGGNLITPDFRVVNEDGQVVQNDALPMTPIAPKLSAPLEQKDLPVSAIKLTADSSGFRPAEFRVKAAQPVTVSLTAIGLGSRLVFKDSSLAALELTVPADYTMAKTFKAPDVPGEYVFYQDMPGRFQQTGKMIVE